MEENTLYTVTVYSENQVGLLNQVSIIFTRRNLNIWSLSVSSSAIEGIHKFTIACRTSKAMIEKVVKQIEKRIDVIKAFYYTDDDIIYQEIALYKVPTDKLLECGEFEELVRKHNAKILEMNSTFTVIQKSGHCQETTALFNDLNRYGVLQFVRSGRVAITKSKVEHVTNFIEEQEIRRIHNARENEKSIVE
ncbi:MAG: acetolactate synthase small subunit [Bacteroidales bacterium]|nr:acetolactate synthase small subunit [Bacteroidales bacterium]